MISFNTQGVDVDSIVAEKRQGAIEAQKSSYGANREYAKALNLKFEGFDWFEVSHTDSVPALSGSQAHQALGIPRVLLWPVW